ncbi:hypothetical protein F2Q69_00053756 [Brassica cretica]|uniref:Retrotransposon gag domain-containing protein n=1 Tax=Brassica cretica TaxID=69181 RepID=A0A8S9MPJ0_BRACR|nr:hypothetical protein F2Q69_00053756 [Brassica cretica]
MLRDEEDRTRNSDGQLINAQGAVIPDVIVVAKMNDFNLSRECWFSQLQTGSLTSWEDIERAFLYKFLDDSKATREKEKNYKWDRLVESWQIKMEDQIPRQLLDYIMIEGDEQHVSGELSRVEEADISDTISASIAITTITSTNGTTSTSTDDTTSTSTDGTTSTSTDGTTSASTDGTTTMSIDGRTSTSTDSRTSTSTDSRTSTSTDGMTITSTNDRISTSIDDSTLKRIDISSCDPTSDGDREITMENFLELEEFLELEDGEKLEDLDSSREVTMEDFLELEKWLEDMDQNSKKKLDDDQHTSRGDLETSPKASIDRHQPDEIDRQPPYIIDQLPPYIIDRHPWLDELPGYIVELEQVEEMMSTFKASHPAVHGHQRPPICAKEGARFHKRVKKIHDPVKIVVPCVVFEVEFPISPDTGAHLSSYVEVLDDHQQGLPHQDPRNQIEELEDLVSRRSLTSWEDIERAFLHKFLDDSKATREKEKNYKWDRLVESWQIKMEDQIPRQLLDYIMIEGDEQHVSGELSRVEEADISDTISASIAITTIMSTNGTTSTSTDDTTSTSTDGTTSTSTDGTTSASTDSMTTMSIDGRTSTSTDSRTSTSTDGMTITSTNDRISTSIDDSTLKRIDISSCDPTSDGDREITMENFLELEEFLELEDGEKLEDLDSSREVTMEAFIELEKWLKDMDQNSKKKLDDDQHTSRGDLETSPKASIDRHQPDEIDRQPPYIIDQLPPYIIDRHPWLDELPGYIVELEQVEEMMSTFKASHPAVHGHQRPPICAQEGARFHKRVKKIHDPVKIVVPCVVFEVEFPIPPDTGVHLSSYVEVLDDHQQGPTETASIDTDRIPSNDTTDAISNDINKMASIDATTSPSIDTGHVSEQKEFDMCGNLFDEETTTRSDKSGGKKMRNWKKRKRTKGGSQLSLILRFSDGVRKSREPKLTSNTKLDTTACLDMRVVNPSLCIDGAQPLVYLPPPPPPRSIHFPANGIFTFRLLLGNLVY